MADKLTKLSDAIRLGATFRPQCRNGFFVRGGSCALGAAYEAITGIGTEYEFGQDAREPFAVIADRFQIPRWAFDDLSEDIVFRNDTNCLSREQIADWLESQGY